MQEKTLKIVKKEKEIALLNQAFNNFNLSTLKLKDSYAQLQRLVSMLDLELEEKNRQLETHLRAKDRIEEYLRTIVESLDNGVVVVDEKGMITTFNRAAELITDVAREDIEGRYFDEVLKPLLPDTFPCAFPVRDTQQRSEGEFSLSKQDGNEVRVTFTINALRGNKKELEGSVIIFQDVTRLRKLEEQAERTNRLAAMGEIAVNIAHEVRNPLGSIELFASLLRREEESNETNRRLADHIVSGVKSIDCIISNLLLFSKPQHPVFEKISIHAVLEESLLFVAPSLRQGRVEIIRQYGSFEPHIMGDQELLKQVFLNLIWNGLQSMPRGGKLTVLTRKVKSGLEASPVRDYLELVFKDTGVGIAEHDRKKIFTPFFTTKEKGAGLGLAIVHRIIEAHGGIIEVNSGVFKGSTFTITLPLLSKST